MFPDYLGDFLEASIIKSAPFVAGYLEFVLGF